MNKITNNQLYRLIVAHCIEIIREPAVLFWGILFPILMAWGLGIAFTQKHDEIHKIAIVKYSGTEHDSGKSKLLGFLEKNVRTKNGQFTVELKNSKLGNSSLIFFESTWNDAYTMLKKGNINVIVEDHTNDIKYHFDPASSDAQKIYHQIADMLDNGINYYSANQETIKPLTISGTRYIDFLIPGLLAMGIMMSCTWGISYTIIERRSKKLLRRMVATPMKKSNFLIALITARVAMNIFEALILILFSWLYFDIHFQGSIMALIAVFITGNIAFSGLSILISSHTANSEIGNGIINAVVTPMMVLSGIFFSYHNFPEWSLPVIRNLPLTMLADSIRSIFNEGVGFAEVYREILVLLATGIVSFVIGLKIFKWY
jgi:ABC-type multidrug transport system permease subunit